MPLRPRGYAVQAGVSRGTAGGRARSGRRGNTQGAAALRTLYHSATPAGATAKSRQSREPAAPRARRAAAGRRRTDVTHGRAPARRGAHRAAADGDAATVGAAHGVRAGDTNAARRGAIAAPARAAAAPAPLVVPWRARRRRGSRAAGGAKETSRARETRAGGRGEQGGEAAKWTGHAKGG